MPEVDSYKILNGSDPTQISSFVYGRQSIEDNSPSDQPYTGAWFLLEKKNPKMPGYINTPFVNQGESEIFIIDLPESQDTITQESLLKSEENQVQELIFRIKKSLSISYQERLANRLLTLFKDAKEEDPDCVGISAESLQNFFNFLQFHSKIKCPTISLTPDYNIYSSWRNEQNRVFSIHFLPDGEARFVIFKPNARHPKRKIRIFGVATTDVLMETVAPHDIEDWISA